MHMVHRPTYRLGVTLPADFSIALHEHKPADGHSQTLHPKTSVPVSLWNVSGCLRVQIHLGTMCTWYLQRRDLAPLGLELHMVVSVRVGAGVGWEGWGGEEGQTQVSCKSRQCYRAVCSASA